MLFRKMIRDMKLHKMQFISIFLMSFLGVYIYTGIGGEWTGLQKTVNKYYKETNFADAWIYGENFSKKDEDAVKKVKGIKDVQRRLTFNTTGDFKNNPTIVLNYIEKSDISRCYTVRGEKFSLQKDGIWLDDRFAKAKNLKIGDSITVKYNGLSITKKILGTMYNPEYVYAAGSGDLVPNYSNLGYAFLSYKAFPKNAGISYNQILIKTNRKDFTKLESSISKALNKNYSAFITRDSNGSYAMFRDEITQHKSMGSIFPTVFLLIAMLVILTTMTRIVSSQRTQIGTLKAIGFKKRRILLHYISYGFITSFLGSVIAVISGPVTLPRLFYPSMSSVYTLPEWKPSFSYIFIIMAVLSTAACTFVTYIACRNILKDTPSETLHPKAPKSIKHSFLEKTGIWNKIGFNAKWNIRDISRSKVRSIMAIFGVLGCSALLVCAFGLHDCLKDVMTWQYDDINKFQTKLNVDKNASPEQISYALKKSDGQKIMESNIEIKANNVKKSGSIMVTDNTSLIKTTDINRNYIILPKYGISISYKMAELLNVKKGDEIKWHIFGDEKWINSRIAAIYRTPTQQGITVTKNYFESLHKKFTPTSIITAKKIKNKYPGISSIWSKSQLTKSWNDMSKAMNTMVYVLICAASVLAVVVLYNLGLLSFTEMGRELATLKVLGFKAKKIRHILLTQDISLSAAGIIIGIPCGIFLMKWMVTTMGDTFDMIAIITPLNIITSTLITFFLSIIVNLMFSKKIRQIDMVSSLKGVE